MMKNISLYQHVAISAALLSLIFCSAASAAVSPDSQVHAMVGTFNCVTTGSNKLTWRFHSVNSAWGSAWMRADTTFSPQHGQPADRESTYLGYDASAKRWNIVSVDADGSYFTRYSGSAKLDGAHWLDGYPADRTKATLRIAGTPGYIFDTQTPASGGHADWSHTVCSRNH